MDASDAVVILCELYLSKRLHDAVQVGKCFVVVGHREIVSSRTLKAISVRGLILELLVNVDAMLVHIGHEGLRWHRVLESTGDVTRFWESSTAVARGEEASWHFHDGDDDNVDLGGNVACRVSTACPGCWSRSAGYEKHLTSFSGSALEIVKSIPLPPHSALLLSNGSTLQSLLDAAGPGQSQAALIEEATFACVAWKVRGSYYEGRVKKKDVFWASTALGAAQGIAMFQREASKALGVTQDAIRASINGRNFVGDNSAALQTFFDDHWRPDVQDSSEAWIKAECRI